MTASTFGMVAKCGIYEGHAKQLLYPTCSVLNSAAIQWGKDNKPTARQQYSRHISQTQQLKVLDCGLFVSTSGILAATPGGLVCQEDGTPIGTLEIKCPYTVRNMTVLEAYNVNSFYCKLETTPTGHKSIHLKGMTTTIRYKVKWLS